MYTITPTSTGADLAFGKGGDLFNNVYLSLTVEQGSWWVDRTFGVRTRKRRKNTPATASLLQQDCRDALQWLLDAGRATAITVTPVADPENRSRLRMQCTVTGARGEIVAYDKFIEVV